MFELRQFIFRNKTGEQMSIVPHPEFIKLKKDCEILHSEFAELIVGLDELTSTIIPNIETEYQLTIGHLEYEQLCLQIEINRLKRKIEIIQAAINHGDQISEISIDEMLSKEFKKWENKLKEHLKKIDIAKKRSDSKLSIEESREIADLYRKIVKKIHPDINHELFCKHKNLWLRAVEAYNHGILESLKAIWLIIQELSDESRMMSSLEAISLKKEDLKNNITMLLSKINEIKSAHPYNLQEKLLDSSWVQNKQSVLYKSIADLSTHKIRLKIYLEQMSGVNKL